MDFINHNCDPIELKELSLFLIMYADDMAIFSRDCRGFISYVRKPSTETHVLTFEYIDLMIDNNFHCIPITGSSFHKFNLSTVPKALV
jgi:hypothetical protein